MKEINSRLVAVFCHLSFLLPLNSVITGHRKFQALLSMVNDNQHSIKTFQPTMNTFTKIKLYAVGVD